MERARAEARKAIALDETLAEAHTSLGWVTFIYDWDWVGAEREFSRAIQLNPVTPLHASGTPGSLRPWAGSTRRWPRAVRPSSWIPLSVSIRRSMGWLQYYARHFDGALENLRRALAMDPTAEETHRLLGLVYTAARAVRRSRRFLQGSRGEFGERHALLCRTGPRRGAARDGQTRREPC